METGKWNLLELSISGFRITASLFVPIKAKSFLSCLASTCFLTFSDKFCVGKFSFKFVILHQSFD